jgi:hypothetical protein
VNGAKQRYTIRILAGKFGVQMWTNNFAKVNLRVRIFSVKAFERPIKPRAAGRNRVSQESFGAARD